MLRLALTLVAMVTMLVASTSYAVWRGEAPVAIEPHALVAAGPEAPEAAEIEVARPSAEPAILGVVVPQTEVVVSAAVEATIAAVKVQLGDVVNEGDLLATIDVRVAQLELQAARARASALLAQRDQAVAELGGVRDRRDRSRRLRELVPEEQRQQLEFEVDASRAALERTRSSIAEAHAEADKLEQLVRQGELRAPFAGVVAHRHVDPGARVPAGAPIVQLIGGAPRMRWAVPAGVGLRPGDTLTARCEHGTEAEPVVVERVAPQIEAASRMVLMEGRLTSARLRVGTVCRLEPTPPAAI